MDNDPDYYVRLYQAEQKRFDDRLQEMEPPIWTSVVLLVVVIACACAAGAALAGLAAP